MKSYNSTYSILMCNLGKALNQNYFLFRKYRLVFYEIFSQVQHLEKKEENLSSGSSKLLSPNSNLETAPS